MYLLRTIIFSGDFIQFTHFHNEDKNVDFISTASNIRNISLNENELFSNGNIEFENYNDIMMNLFLCKDSRFITEWGIEIVPFDICNVGNNVERNTINQFTV